MYRAGRHDHTIGANLHVPAVAHDANAGGAAAAHHQPLDMALGPDRQIGAPARRSVEIGGRRRNPAIVPVREGRRENSILEFAVLVAPERNAAGGEGRADRRAERRPLFP